MVGRMLSRLRQVAPSPGAIVGFLAVFLFFEGTILYLESRNIPIAAHLPFRPGRALLYLASVQHGLSRVVAFHPIWQKEYRTWLESTPWTIRKPLPIGPVEFVWEDGLTIGPLILLSAALPEPRSMHLLCAFLVSHVLALTMTLWLTRIRAIGYATAFGLGLALWLWRQPIACLAAATLVYLVAYEGLRRGLEQFPWKPRKLPNPNTDLTSGVDPAESCGWPYDRMMRDTSIDSRISRIDAVFCCMLGSWWLFVLASLIPDPLNRTGFLFIPFMVSTMVFPFGRLGIYIIGYQSPITLWGRIRTFRWIIPCYDHVFVAPICALLASPIALMFLFQTCGLQLDVCLPIATGATALVALIAPPRLRRWRLTGRHRIVHTLTKASTAFVQVG